MNLTEEFNQIILKYNLDIHYPRFRKKIYAEQIILSLFADNEDIPVVLLGVKKTDVDYTGMLLKNKRHIEKRVTNPMELSSLDYESFCGKKVYYVSRCERKEIEFAFAELGISFVDLYSVLADHGLLFDDEYYRVTKEYDKELNDYKKRQNVIERPQVEYSIQTQRYFIADNEEEKTDALEKLFFLALYMKDFVAAEKHMESLVCVDTAFNVYAAWQEISALMQRCKRIVQSRTKEDIIMFWLDALSFDEIKNMPYLQEIMNRSVSFQHAYTVSTNTRPALMSMFCQKTIVTGRSYKQRQINETNSTLLAYLAEHDYTVKFDSTVWTDELEEKMKATKVFNLYAPASSIYFDMLDILCETEEKLFLVVHSCFEMHAPYLSCKMRPIDFAIGRHRRRFELGMETTDEQLRYYNAYLGCKATKIFMSDHGNPYEFNKGFHINFHILKEKWSAKKIEGIFSILDFEAVIRQIIEKEEFDEKSLVRDWAPIEKLDLYDKELVEQTLLGERNMMIEDIGFIGAITKDEIYLRFETGEEYASKTDRRYQPPYNFIDNQIMEGIDATWFREKVEEYPLEIFAEDKFKQSKRFREKYMRCKNCLEETLAEYPDNSVLIRMGGKHSEMLYRLLSEVARKKIKGFIDKDATCICSKYEKPILNVGEMDENVKGIILSSYKFLNMLREEAKSYPEETNIIDIYAMWEMLGWTNWRDFFIS